MNSILKQVDDQGQVVGVYEVVRTLGTGGFATVYEVVSLQSGERYAAKTISKLAVNDSKAFEKLRLEIKIHKKLKHRNIVSLERIFEDEDNIYLLMELCSNLTLKQLQMARSRLTQMEVRYFSHQIISGLEYLHFHRILHRDIKLGNIFINEKMELKIGDFGLSVRLRSLNEKRFTTCGTPNYIAPETLQSSGHSFGVDVWALGVIAYTLLIGKPPFERETMQETYNAVRELKYSFPLSIPISENAKSLILSILKDDPQQRISLSQLKAHPFLNKTVNIIPQTLPKEILCAPPNSRFLKSYNSLDNFKIPILPRRLSQCNNAKDCKSSKKDSRERITSLKRYSKSKRSCSFQPIKCGSTSFQQRPQPTISKISTSRKNAHNSESKTKNILLGSRERSKIDRLSKQLQPKPKQPQDDEIVDHVDWSDKYGIGYVLTSGTVGFVFNDKTCLARFRNSYIYLDKEGQELRCDQQQIPVTLLKKLKILKQAESMLKQVKGPKIFRKKIVYVRRFLKKLNTLILKRSDDNCHFLWQDCQIRLKRYKEVHWRLESGDEGSGTILQDFQDRVVNQRVRTLRLILSELIQRC